MFYVGAILTISSIATIVYSIIDYVKHDVYTGSALTVEIGMGIVIAWIVFIYSKKWDKENKKVTADIKMLTENLKQITDDVRQTVIEESAIRKEMVSDMSFYLDRNLNRVILELNESLQMYDNYKNNKDGRSEYWMVQTKEWYSRAHHSLDFKIGLLDLMKIFGVNISRKYWDLFTDLQITSSIYKDVEIKNMYEFAGLISNALDKAKELKNIIEPYLHQKSKSQK